MEESVRLTAITGLEKGSGKTTFLNALLPGERKKGPVALFSIGVDGRLKARDGGREAEVRVEAGDVVLTTDLLARASTARLSILDVLPGRSVLGRAFVGRVVRSGEVTLAGIDNLATLSETISRVVKEEWAVSCLVDGAANRLTQVSALSNAGFIFTARVDPANLARVSSQLEALVALASLPVVPEPSPAAFLLEGPLTEEIREELPANLEALSLADFTKSFLPPRALLRLLESVTVSVRRGVRLLGIAATLRDVTFPQFHEAVGHCVSAWLLPNPYEVGAA